MKPMRAAVACLSSLWLAGCSVLGGSTDTPPSGLVVGDEPYAVQAGATALAHGGSAADAVAATYFALAVTYPVAAGLGGGGLCIVHDPQLDRTEAFEFLARDGANPGEFAVPGNVSGFSLLQAAYGRLPWQRVVSPGEGYAASGFPISHALATRLAQSQDIIRLDAGLSAEFLDESGHLKPEGAYVTAPALAQTLSAIRAAGPVSFYRGSIADEIVRYAGSQNGGVAAADLQSYAPVRSPALAVTIGSETAFVPPARLGAGKFTQALLSRLVGPGVQVAAGANLSAAVAAATGKTMEDFGLAALPRDLGATGFAAEDSYGQAAACAVTMNGPFGSGHSAGATGVTLAHAPHLGQSGLSAAFLTPVVAMEGEALGLVGAGAGGPNGTAAIGLALLRFGQGLDVSQHTTGLAPFDTVNVIACQNGHCAGLPDSGGFGLAASGQS
jgi:gamma-glutamyltranspeptidase/glutathione hydrolase